MRIIEVTEPDHMKLIQRDCQPFLKQAEGGILYRGTRNDMGTFAKVAVRKDRKPLSMPTPLNDVLMDAFIEAGVKANRNNSVFCSGNINMARSYANHGVYKIYPIGDFDFAWSPNVRDLYATVFKWMHNHKIKQTFPKDFTLKQTGRFSDYKEDQDLPLNDFIAKHNIERFLDLDVPYTLEFPELQELIKENYKTTDLSAAIESQTEIMIACNHVYAILEEIDKPNRIGWT